MKAQPTPKQLMASAQRMLADAASHWDDFSDAISEVLEDERAFCGVLQLRQKTRRVGRCANSPDPDRNPTEVPMASNNTPAMTRLLSRIEIDPETGCWEWQGKRHPRGYGSFMANSRHVGTHRFAYEKLVGPIPDGLWICHHCDNPPCCNPDHLFAGTPQDNIRDMDRKGRRPVRPPRGPWKTECIHGHAYTPENTYTNPQGERICRTCNRIGNNERYARLNPDKGIWPRDKTHCVHGHEYTPENTYWRGPKKTHRSCRQCDRTAAKARYDLRKVAK